jgi:hypothetical protein
MALPSVAPTPSLLPRLRHPDAALEAWAESLVRALEDELARLRTPAGRPWSLANAPSPRALADPSIPDGGASRALDPTTATLPSLAANLATLIGDLQTKGSIA